MGSLSTGRRAMLPYSLPPCGGGSGRAVSNKHRTRGTPTPNPSPQGGGERAPCRSSPSRRLGFRSQRREGLAFGGEALQQRGGFEARVVGLLGVERQPVRDVLEADRIGIEHRAAAIDRPAVT